MSAQWFVAVLGTCLGLLITVAVHSNMSDLHREQIAELQASNRRLLAHNAQLEEQLKAWNRSSALGVRATPLRCPATLPRTAAKSQPRW